MSEYDDNPATTNQLSKYAGSSPPYSQDDSDIEVEKLHAQNKLEMQRERIAAEERMTKAKVETFREIQRGRNADMEKIANALKPTIVKSVTRKKYFFGLFSKEEVHEEVCYPDAATVRMVDQHGQAMTSSNIPPTLAYHEN